LFEKLKAIQHHKIKAYSENCSIGLKRIKLLDDGGYIILENDHIDATIYHFNEDGIEQKRYIFNDCIDGKSIIDYYYLEGKVYLLIGLFLSEYDEALEILRSDSEKVINVTSIVRESYQHDMDYFSFFIEDQQLYLFLIRHNRVHKYHITDKMTEINYVQCSSSFRWFLSSTYALAIDVDGRCEWELYDPNLELIGSFEHDEKVDWIDIVASEDKEIIAITTNDIWDESSSLIVFDKQSKQFKVHYQRYEFYTTAVIGGRVWTTVTGRYSGVDGLMIFDRKAALKFSILRDKIDSDKIRAFQLFPLAYECVGIEELPENKVMLIEQEQAIITDITYRELGNITFSAYDMLALSDDKHKLAVLDLIGRSHADDYNVEYTVKVDLYSWNKSAKTAEVIDLGAFRR